METNLGDDTPQLSRNRYVSVFPWLYHRTHGRRGSIFFHSHLLFICSGEPVHFVTLGIRRHGWAMMLIESMNCTISGASLAFPMNHC
jgi:hypothetical protein